MAKIATTAEADALAKQNIPSRPFAVPVVTGEPRTLEGTDIQYWPVLYTNPEHPDSESEFMQGAAQFIADNGQVMTRNTGPKSSNPQSFKDWLLSQYRGADY